MPDPHKIPGAKKTNAKAGTFFCALSSEYPEINNKGETQMKKLFAMALAAVMMLSLAACGAKKEEAKDVDLAAF